MQSAVLTGGLSLYSPGQLQWQPTIFYHADNLSVIALDNLTFAPKRSISNTLRNALEASSSGEVVLVFATITHDDLAEPIRVVSEDQGGVSYQNGEIVNYKYGGNLYLGTPFLTQLISDDDRAPRGVITVPDVDREISLQVLALNDSPEITIEILKRSDFSDTLDGDNARTPTATPTVEYSASGFLLRNVSGDAVAVQAELQTAGIRGEPWPKTRATQDLVPGLYKL